MDELYEVAKQFTENDPDGNGVDDTVGFGDRAPSDIRYTSFKLFTSYFGAPNGWAVDDNGKFTPEFDTEEYMKALNFQEIYLRMAIWHKTLQLPKRLISKNNLHKEELESTLEWWISRI